MKTYWRIILLIAIFVTSCSPLRHLDDLQRSADASYLEGDHAAALTAYEELIASYREADIPVDGQVSRRAGLLAFEAEETARAIEYLEMARLSDALDAEATRALAISYREVDNLSREIRMLEHYVATYPGGDHFTEMQQRLFETLVESLNFQQAYELWPELEGEPRKDEGLSSRYLQVLISLEQQAEATALAEDLLAMNRNNLPALDFLAKKHFRQADQLYRREMQAYEANRTHRQYARLLEALEVVNTDLRIALDYFTRLYRQNPNSEYASYLANIYERFQDEENARYYRRRAE